MKSSSLLPLGFILLGAISCDKIWIHPHPPVARVQPEEAAEEPTAISHRVNKGETLFKIAKQYTGRGQNWKAIAAFNTGLKPGALKPGQEILIPASVLSSDATTYAGLDTNPELSYARFSLKNEDQPLTAKASMKARMAKNDAALAKAQKKSLKLAAKRAPALKETPIIKAKANTKIAPIVGDTPILKSPPTSSRPEAIEEFAEFTKPSPIGKVPPVIAAVPEIAPIAPTASITKKKNERVITAKTPIQKLEPTKSAIISKKDGRAHAREMDVNAKEPVAEEQSSRSSFYSCMADKCSLHNF